VARLVLSDASPLIGLSNVDGLPWLPALFGKVWIPTEVHDEVLSGHVSRGEAAIRSAIKHKWLAIWKGVPADAELPHLDEGESACIRIALKHRGDALLLIDERAGRAVAQEHGIRVAGTAAVIGMAKQRGLIPSAKVVFARLHASDFRISAEVIRTVLAHVGEN
jgi:predicted nucleic acid-binding protein